MISLCGTQSRTRHVTSAPSAIRRWTSQPPRSPVAPVTKVGRSRQKLLSIFGVIQLLLISPFPNLPRRLAVAPEALKQNLVAQSVHALPEAAVAIGGELAVGGQPLHRVGLQATAVTAQVVEDFRLEHEEAAVDPALPDLRLLGELG